MIQNFISMNGYGFFVWLSFAITFLACGTLYYKTYKTLKKENSVKSENSVDGKSRHFVRKGNCLMLKKAVCFFHSKMQNQRSTKPFEFTLKRERA